MSTRTVPVIDLSGYLARSPGAEAIAVAEVRDALERVGFFTPKMTQVDELGPGEIGFITAAIKEVADTRVGDTITTRRNGAAEALPVRRRAKGATEKGTVLPARSQHARAPEVGVGPIFTSPPVGDVD